MSLELRVEGAAGALEIDVELTIGPEGLVVFGENGAGKTTLLRLVLGAERPRRGRVALGGRVLFDATEGIDLPIEARRLGWVPQHHALFPHLSARENVAFGLRRGEPTLGDRARHERAGRLLEALEAGATADRRPASLSGGERQRVALARALASGAEALLFDEPLASLDVQARAETRAFLARTLARTRVPFVFVTHDVEDAAALGSPAAVLERGRVTWRGPLDELLARPSSAFAARLAGRSLG